MSKIGLCVALTLALTPLHAGCSTTSGNRSDAAKTATSDAWLGTARVAAGSPQSVFDVQLDAETTSPEAPGKSHFLHLAGTWTFTKVSGGVGRQVLAQLQLNRLELSDEHALPVGKDKYKRRIQTEFERAVLFDLDDRGAVVGMHAPRDLVSTALGGIRMLAANFQLTAPPVGADSWTAREQDASGTYSAEYRTLGAHAIARKKTGYTALPTPEPDSPPVKYEIRKSETRFELSATGAIASSAGSESVLLDDGEGALPPLEMNSHFRITRKTDTTQTDLPEQPSRLQALPARPLSATPDPEAQTYEIDLVKAAGGTRIDDILGDMARTDPETGQGGDPHAFRRLTAALEAAVRIDEDAEQSAFARSEAGQPYTAEVLSALARSNRSETLLRLAQLLQTSQRIAPNVRARTLMALSTNASATQPVARAIEALSSDPAIGDGAVLGLGALCFRLQQTNPPLSREIYESLAARLDRAQTTEQTELALRALGNAGNSAALPKLERFLTAEEPKIRAVAVGALRRLQGPAVDALLARVAENDKQEAVQDAVHSVLSTRKD